METTQEKNIAYCIDSVRFNNEMQFYTMNKKLILPMIKYVLLSYDQDSDDGDFFNFKIRTIFKETITIEYFEKRRYVQGGKIIQTIDILKKENLDIPTFKNFDDKIYILIDGSGDNPIPNKYVSNKDNILLLAKDFLESNDINYEELNISYDDSVKNEYIELEYNQIIKPKNYEDGYGGDEIHYEHDILERQLYIEIYKNFKQAHMKNKSKEFNI